MTLTDKIYNLVNKNYLLILYISIASIFINPVKLYIPMFVLTILSSAIIYFKTEDRKILKWQKLLIAFIIFTVAGSVINLIFNKYTIDLSLVVKFIINTCFLLSVSMVLPGRPGKKDLRWFILLLEAIIAANFIQVIYIYLSGNLFMDFLSGKFTGSSDAAYIVTSFYHFIGAENKNVWATKLAFIELIYLYLLNSGYMKLKNRKIITILTIGLITEVLLLSRTAQVAIIIGYAAFTFIYINKLQKKYRDLFYKFGIAAMALCLIIFFKKFFHVSFTMKDGGFTRLLLWKEFFGGFISSNWLIGNGPGSAAELINSTLGRTESNFHNTFINTAFELGIAGLIIYVLFLKEFFKGIINKKNLVSVWGILIVPMLLILFLQYVGYDNDVVVFLMMAYMCRVLDDNNTSQGETNEKI